MEFESLRSLHDILKHCFGCEEPFLKKRELDYVESDGTEHYNCMTESGIEAYNKLISLLYGLENMGVIDYANDIIGSLDSIVDGNDY